MQWRGRRTLLATAVVAVVLAVLFVVGLLRICRISDPPSDASTPAIEGLPITPPLGWNSWNAYGCDVDEAKVRRAADALVDSGMRDAGYRYVVVDDCWFAPERSASGELLAEPSRFPSGIRALADYVHAKGLKFGIYEGASSETCAQAVQTYPGHTGSRGHERQDARTFADWGVDFLKYDWCGPAADPDEVVRVFTAMRDAIRATGRAILYSINPNSGSRLAPGELHRFAEVATMTRVSQDVIPIWHELGGGAAELGLRDAVENAAGGGIVCAPAPGSFCDYDMLVVESPPVDISAPLTEAEGRTQFAMWAMWASPLFAGNDLAAMSPQARSLLTNRGVLAIDQDPFVHPPSMAPGSGGSIWTRPLSDGSTALALVNREDAPRFFSLPLTELGLPFAHVRDVEDVYTGVHDQWRGAFRIEVPPHDTALLRFRVVS